MVAYVHRMWLKYDSLHDISGPKRIFLQKVKVEVGDQEKSEVPAWQLKVSMTLKEHKQSIILHKPRILNLAVMH